MSKRTHRILLSPLLFLYGLMISAGGLIFPFPLLCMIQFVFLLSMPFIWLTKQAGAQVFFEPAFVEPTRYLALNYIISIFIPIWLPFYITFVWIQTGEIVQFD